MAVIDLRSRCEIRPPDAAPLPASAASRKAGRRIEHWRRQALDGLGRLGADAEAIALVERAADLLLQRFGRPFNLVERAAPARRSMCALVTAPAVAFAVSTAVSKCSASIAVSFW